MRTDSDPAAELQESMLATLYVHHPYGTPVIGWGHEIEGLEREDALAYYRRFYAPENAILIVAGDIEESDVRRLAEAHYGKVPRQNQEAPQRRRLREPAIKARRLVSLADSKVEQPMVQQAYLVPCHNKAEGNEAFALEVLNQMLGGSQTSRLYRKLVVADQVAVGTGSWYWNDALDIGQFGTWAIPAEGIELEALDRAIEAVIDEFRTALVDQKELDRAKTRLVADMIYAQDNQAHLARMVGATLSTGGELADLVGWVDRIKQVSAEDVRRVAGKHLLAGRAVVGHLLKAA